ADGRGRVYALRQRNEINTQVVELFKSTEQMRDGTGEPIKPRHNDDVEFSRASVFHEAIKGGSRILAATDPLVSVFFDGLTAAMRGILAKCYVLSLRRLPVAFSANAHVQGSPLHNRPLWQ